MKEEKNLHWKRRAREGGGEVIINSMISVTYDEK